MRALVLFFLTSVYASSLDSVWIEPLSCNALISETHCAILHERLRSELEFSGLVRLSADSIHARWIAESRLTAAQSSLILQWRIREKKSSSIVFSSSALSEDGWSRLADQGINTITQALRQYLNTRESAVPSSSASPALLPPARSVDKITGKILIEPISAPELSSLPQTVPSRKNSGPQWLRWTSLGAAIFATASGAYYWSRTLDERDMKNTASLRYDRATSQFDADQARADYLYHRSKERKALVPTLIWSNAGIGFLYIFSMSFIWF